MVQEEQPRKWTGLELTLMGVIVVASLLFLHVQVTLINPQHPFRTKVCPTHSNYCSTNLFSCAVHLCGECIADDGSCVPKVSVPIAPWGLLFDFVLVVSSAAGVVFCGWNLCFEAAEQVSEWYKKRKTD